MASAIHTRFRLRDVLDIPQHVRRIGVDAGHIQTAPRQAAGMEIVKALRYE